MTRKSGDDRTRWSRNRSSGVSAGCLFAIVLLVAAPAAYAAAPENLATQLKKAVALHAQADYAHSIPILKQIVRQSPRNYQANLLLGEDLLNSGNIQAAFGPLDVACQVRPGDGRAEVYLAEAATALGDFPRASEALQSGIARSGGSGPFLESWAIFCLQRYKILEFSLRTTKRGEATALRVEAAVRPEGSEAREKLLEQSAAGDPEQRGIWGELGTAQLERGMRRPVVQSLKEALQREPQEANTLQLEALLAAAEEKWPVAEERFAVLGTRSPAEMESAVGLWQHLFAPRLSTSGTTWECLRNAKVPCPVPSAQPQSGTSLSAKDLYAQGRWEELIALPLPAMADPSELLWRGVALAKTGNCAQAIPSLERGMKADELVPKFWLDVCYASEGQRAIVLLSQQGNTTALHRLRGDMMLVLRGDAAGAVPEYAEALKLEPRNPHLLEKQAEAYRTLGDTKQAETFARAALDVDAHEFSALQTLAQIAMKDRSYAEALVRLKQLMAIDPNDAWTQVELGVAYGQLGQPEEALRHLEPPLASGYPDNKGAFHAQLASVLRKLGCENDAKQAAAEAERLANAAFHGVEPGSSDAH